MKRTTYTVLLVTLVVTLFLFLSPKTLGVSNNLCSSCHQGSYYQYLDILEGNSANQIPTTLNVSETKTGSILIENRVNTNKYPTLSGVSVTLTSVYGHFVVNGPTYNIGDLPPGTKTATWQITGTSDGFDYLSIEATGYNSHKSIPFSDNYAPIPLIAVGQTTGAPPPPPTPTSPPPPAPASEPSSTSTPAPNSTSSPVPSTTPKPTSAPQNQEQLLISLLSPIGSEKWPSGTTQNIKWNASGGTNPLNIALEYSISGSSGQWMPIAASIPNNGSFTWTVSNVAYTYQIRATVNDSANPPKTASTVNTVEIVEANPELPVIPIAAILLTTMVGVAVFFQRRMKLEAKKFPEQ